MPHRVPRTLNRIICILTVCAASSRLAASDCEYCRDVLVANFRSTFQERYVYDSSFSSTLDLSDLKDEADCSKQAWNAGINVSIPKTPIVVGLKGEHANEACKVLQLLYRESSASTGVESRLVESSKSLLSDGLATKVIAAWQECVTKNCSAGVPIRIGKIPAALGEFSLTISAAPGPPGEAVITDVVTGEVVSCNASEIAKLVGRRIQAGGEALPCKREKPGAGALIVRTTWGTKSETIPAIPPTPTPTPTCAVADGVWYLWEGDPGAAGSSAVWTVGGNDITTPTEPGVTWKRNSIRVLTWGRGANRVHVFREQVRSDGPEWIGHYTGTLSVDCKAVEGTAVIGGKARKFTLTKQ